MVKKSILENFKISPIVGSFMNDYVAFHLELDVDDIFPCGIYHMAVDSKYDSLLMKIPNRLLSKIKTHEGVSEDRVNRIQEATSKSMYVSIPATIFVKDFIFSVLETFVVGDKKLSRVNVSENFLDNDFYLMDGHHRLEVCKRLNLDLFVMVFKEKDVSILPMHRVLNKNLIDLDVKCRDCYDKLTICDHATLCDQNYGMVKIYGNRVDLYNIVNTMIDISCRKDDQLNVSYVGSRHLSLNDFHDCYCLNSTGFFMPSISMEIFYKYVQAGMHFPIKSTCFSPKVGYLNIFIKVE
ncbi:hypothetical protein ACH24_00865 [Francisella persica ATCC VR-331]|uniref:ParB/Sulfiredoxin domain-containing protein n=1 Tax=Francisella persica ATCC VR-331 TaxID=1086726 RepID=A0AAC8ZMH7_9GAMM|nr:DUF1015 family protein [Francisella persica]ALB01367.1 hypothetical protein ACH24_00865 [Francisella persica ATCC VR-331]ANH77655.1 hypothetical protein FSC845_03675 [Francisella persica ATCC VR-331]